MKKYAKLFLLALFAPLFFLSCGDDDGVKFGKASSGEMPDASAEVSTRMECPALSTDGSTVRLSHSTTENGKEVMTYFLEYDKNQNHSRWVAFRFDGITRVKTTGRSDAWSDDPDLPAALRIGTQGFGWNYNRGHLCASEDRVYSVAANAVTYYMTNMSPMLSSFNQGYWVSLEGQVQTLGRKADFADTLYVVKGGTIDQTLGYVTRENGLRVPVPKYYFMALLAVKNNNYSSIGFWMEHKEYGYSYDKMAPLSEIKKHAVSINKLEQLTGINFFPNLTKRGQNEESIEDQLVIARWGF